MEFFKGGEYANVVLYSAEAYMIMVLLSTGERATSKSQHFDHVLPCKTMDNVYHTTRFGDVPHRLRKQDRN